MSKPGKDTSTPSDYTSPPMVIEDRVTGKVTWLLSFAGPNPEADECIELPEKQCWWLYEKIMKIDPNLLEKCQEFSN